MVNTTKQLFCWKLAALLAAASLQTPAAAQEKYRFADLQRQVVLKNLSVSATVNEQAALQADLDDIRLSQLPEFSTYYRFFPDDLTFAENAFGTTHFVGLRLSQNLVDLMKIRPGRIQAAKAALGLKTLQVADEQAKALFDFRIAYVNTLEHRTKRDYYSKLASISQQQLRIKEKQYDHHQELLPSVLAVETEVDDYESQAAFSGRRVDSMERALAAYFDVAASQLAWDDIEETTELPGLPVLLAYASKNSRAVQQFKQSKNIELGRAKASQYNDLRFTPFVGVRFRGDRFGSLGTDPEFGFRFSMPLTYFQKKNNRVRHQEATIVALRQKAETAEETLKHRLSELYDRQELAQAQFSRAEKQRYIYQEKLRIEKSRSEQMETLGSGKPETLLQLQIDYLENALKSKLYAYARLRLYYEIVYACGARDAEELPEQVETPLSSAGTRNALWIWQSGDIVAHRAKRMELLNFCRASNFDQIYFSIDSHLAQQLDYDPRIAAFLRKLHAEGLRISALVGDPSWVRPKRRRKLVDRVNKIVSYNEHSAVEEQFDALHMDIEPHLLPEWHDQQEAVLQDYVATLNTLRQTLRAANSTLAIELDVPVSYNKIAENRHIKNIIRSADTVVIMAYNRPEPDRLLSAVGKLLDISQEFGKPVVIGLNSDDFQTQEELTKLIAEIRQTEPNLFTFSKFAIHDYADFKRLTEKPNEK